METTYKIGTDAVAVPHSAGVHHAAHTGAEHDAHASEGHTTLGFWLYLMSDCLIFAVLFATYGVLGNHTAGGPAGRELFDLRFVLVETMLLLCSSYTFGMAMMSIKNGRGEVRDVIRWLAITFMLGACFIGMEIYEFRELLHEGAGPQRSAALSAFFMLVGTHGMHVAAGLAWIVVLAHQMQAFGLDAIVRRRLACLSLFWHFLDLVWICVFTFVYLRAFA
ncbi:MULTISPECIES: cytochrome o ubiquinol oxidase subunit III [Cupriavidus]|uniref:Cytochrome bo(3) ubiquinol oxidase subunit 3 n=1 Tax=Cupriavidus pinatubonensis (strain JMP 134 / LMG 1197) TaxID=264198 RepID=Q46SF7_CUPPJ|nr:MULTISPECIES: cytochrome o ubiquinol oxidase subunit III [Cupriavidus]QYY28381.1 cytochrome o ubiquinol oxidase subunit III [Cupriavidus pinatubonensis]